MSNRTIGRLVPAVTTPEGDGVTVHRTIGIRAISELDPFLLLDEMDMPAGAKGPFGFPQHPHRGFETVTYMLSGRMAHSDTVGNKGEIGPLDAQWMTAGRGIIHSEMPTSKGEAIRGFQLWVNLPRARKMIPPRYQDVMANTIPSVEGEGFSARLVAGSLLGQEGPVKDIAVKPLFADVTLAGGVAHIPVPTGHTVFLYGIEGSISVAGQKVAPRTLIVLTDGDRVAIEGDAGTRLLLVAGAPIGEPVARYGPFVMTTRDEIIATIEDWNAGRFLHAG
ncbi:MAG: pirin family protein [Alphaproteobacteria bacterium]|nr:MAG: pirin family protein [Alphaproteobacteria bacterium]